MAHLSEWIMLLKSFGETENQGDPLWDICKEKATCLKTTPVSSVIGNDTEEFTGSVREKTSKAEQRKLI